ncbi:MAG: hypothetical protein IJQ16_07315 [Selenomonadaceae bacterium]|nr:hypothetical protein [Selenomonadaceae bacterium]
MADVVKIEKPLTSHFVSATYEVYTANDEQALEEVKELLELNKKIQNVRIIINVRKGLARQT